MSVELILNPRVSGYEQIQSDLQSEFAALKSLSYTKELQPPPPGALSGEEEVVKFIFEHPTETALVAAAAFRLATAIVEMVRAVVERRNVPSAPKNPVAVLIVNNQTLNLPSSPQKEGRFLAGLKAGLTKGKPKRSSAKKKKNGRSR